ncbi:MAG: DNA primase [Pseudomonadota bacterium]|nr:DNA primase [Pseudomonadota bacterium]
MAGLIPQNFIDDLVDKSDIVDVVGSRINLKKAGREYKACCPFHGEKTASFTVSPEKGFYHCFGCGAHGTAIGFLMEHDGLEFVDAIEELASINGLEVPRESGVKTDQSGLSELYKLLDEATKNFSQQLKGNPEAIQYLKNRGLNGETVARYRIGYAPSKWDFLLKKAGNDENKKNNLLKTGLVIKNESGRLYDRFRHRIIFPILDSRGRTIAFGGRVLAKEEPKYLNSPETAVFHKGKELYGLYEAKKADRTLNSLIIVEGYMDVLALACNGINNALATLGTATTSDHLKRIFRISNEVIFCFDGDRAGREAAWRALNASLTELKDGRQVKFLFLEEGQDPDSVINKIGSDGFRELLAGAMPLSDYLLNHLKNETDLESMDGLARLAELAKPLISRIPAGIYQELLIDKLANTLGLGKDRLSELLDKNNQKKSKNLPDKNINPDINNKPIARSGHVRQAIRLTLQKPSICSKLFIPDELHQINRLGINLLIELLNTSIKEPDIKPARLAMHFKDHPDGGNHLVKLLTQDIPLSDSADWNKELQATLKAICYEELERRFSELSNKTNVELSDAEKKEFRNLQKKLSENRADD